MLGFLTVSCKKSDNKLEMRVRIFGGRYAALNARVLPLARILNTFGVECDVITPLDWSRITKGKLSNILSATISYHWQDHLSTVASDPDIVIIERTSNLEAYFLEKVLKHKKVKVVFDLSDALFLSSGSIFGMKVRPGSFCLERIIRDVDYVTTNGHYLLNYVKNFNKNSCIIHDPVDTELFHPKNKVKNNDKIIITWEGDARVNYENLPVLVKPLKKIAKEYGKRVKFKIVSYLGDQRVKALFSPLEKFIEVDYGSERWLPMEEFAKMLYGSDIMVAPLRRTLWYEGKSALRVGIGMAMGIPVVASPVGEQKYVIKHEVNGFLAKKEEEWYECLKMLIEDDNLRRKIGKEGRKTVVRELSLKVNGKKLYEILEAITN